MPRDERQQGYLKEPGSLVGENVQTTRNTPRVALADSIVYKLVDIRGPCTAHRVSGVGGLFSVGTRSSPSAAVLWILPRLLGRCSDRQTRAFGPKPQHDISTPAASDQEPPRPPGR
ncbi:hypothetical protein RRF57_004987 [Xylaria bambusicola]|uniref:Uncharacterized protein n=1 Tax=Xylaria bambusicola TaxID=326684 RepID=A0AAN7Z506_9PEZI